MVNSLVEVNVLSCRVFLPDGGVVDVVCNAGSSHHQGMTKVRDGYFLNID